MRFQSINPSQSKPIFALLLCHVEKSGKSPISLETPREGGWRAVDILLGDKMNLTVRLGKQFPESSLCLPRQLGTGQQGRHTNGTLIKQFT